MCIKNKSALNYRNRNLTNLINSSGPQGAGALLLALKTKVNCIVSLVKWSIFLTLILNTFSDVSVLWVFICLGIWYNEKRDFLVWVNEEDHLRVISMQEGGDMGSVFKRFCEGLQKFEGAIKRSGEEFMHNDHLGYILTCPSNLGTGLRGGVHVKLPNIGKVSNLLVCFLNGSKFRLFFKG